MYANTAVKDISKNSIWTDMNADIQEIDLTDVDYVENTSLPDTVGCHMKKRWHVKPNFPSHRQNVRIAVMFADEGLRRKITWINISFHISQEETSHVISAIMCHIGREMLCDMSSLVSVNPLTIQAVSSRFIFAVGGGTFIPPPPPQKKKKLKQKLAYNFFKL